jgi:AcrR family transcriptional regulator
LPRTLGKEEIAAFRDKLCATATRLFAETGVGGVTMRKLAAALGVSAMTPYRYFRDKDEILATIRTDAFLRMARALETAYAAPAAPIDKAIALRDAYVRFALENPESYRLMFDLKQKSDIEYPELCSSISRAQDTQRRFVRDLVAQGVLSGNPDLIGQVFWSTLHGAVSLRISGNLSSDFALSDVLEAANRALLEGFKPKNTLP